MTSTSKSYPDLMYPDLMYPDSTDIDPTKLNKSVKYDLGIVNAARNKLVENHEWTRKDLQENDLYTQRSNYKKGTPWQRHLLRQQQIIEADNLLKENAAKIEKDAREQIEKEAQERGITLAPKLIQTKEEKKAADKKYAESYDLYTTKDYNLFYPTLDGRTAFHNFLEDKEEYDRSVPVDASTITDLTNFLENKYRPKGGYNSKKKNKKRKQSRSKSKSKKSKKSKRSKTN